MPASLACSDLAGYLYRAAKPEQLLGECRLTRIWVRNNGEGTAALYFNIDGIHKFQNEER